MQKSDFFVQKGDIGEITFRNQRQVKTWDCDLSGDGEGVTIQYGVFPQDDVGQSVPGFVLWYPFFVFTPSLADGRIAGPRVVVDAYPGGTVRFPSGNVKIAALAVGQYANMGPFVWHWAAASGVGPVVRAPTYTEWSFQVAASTIGPLMQIPNRAKAVRVNIGDATYSTGTFYEYGIDGVSRYNAELLTTRDVLLSNGAYYYRIGNTNTSFKQVTPIFTLDV